MKKKKQKKVAIVTGASRGIGKAIALKLDKEGFVTVLVSRSPENLKIALKDFSKKAITLPADVSKEKAVVSMVGKVVKKFGRIDVLVNNAGLSQSELLSAKSRGVKSIDQLTKKDFDQLIGTNFTGAFFCMRECIKQMKKQAEGGQIINISSLVAKVVLPEKYLQGRNLYAAAKAALGHLANSIQVEVAKFRIKIATIYPGIVFTERRASKGIFDIEELRQSALKLEDIAHIVWMIIKQGENSNISEVTVQPLINTPLLTKPPKLE